MYWSERMCAARPCSILRKYQRSKYQRLCAGIYYCSQPIPAPPCLILRKDHTDCSITPPPPTMKTHQKNHTVYIGIFLTPNVTSMSPYLINKKKSIKEPFSPFPPGATCLSPCLDPCKETLKITHRRQSLCHLVWKHPTIHKITQTRYEPFACSWFDKSVSQFNRLKTHQNTHSRKSLLPVHCVCRNLILPN